MTHRNRIGPRAAFAMATAAVLAAGLLPPRPAAAESAPLARTQQMIAVMESIEPEPEQGDLAPATQAANCDAFAELDKIFALDRMVDQAIAPNREAFTAAQVRKLKADFRELIRELAYPRSGNFFREAQYDLAAAEIDGNSADVRMDAYLPAEDWRNRVTYHWEKNGDWRLVDASFDGDSLVKDYQNQFARIIAEEGVDGLMAKVDKKLAAARKDPSGCR